MRLSNSQIDYKSNPFLEGCKISAAKSRNSSTRELVLFEFYSNLQQLDISHRYVRIIPFPLSGCKHSIGVESTGLSGKVRYVAAIHAFDSQLGHDYFKRVQSAQDAQKRPLVR